MLCIICHEQKHRQQANISALDNVCVCGSGETEGEGQRLTSGVCSKTAGSILSYGNTPICSPLRFVRKLTQNASSLGVPSRRNAAVSSPNWRHISSVLGHSAWAFGAASRCGYFSTIRDLTAGSGQSGGAIDSGSWSCFVETVPPNLESRAAASSPVGPPPTMRTGTWMAMSCSLMDPIVRSRAQRE